jgi:hypothetical protein
VSFVRWCQRRNIQDFDGDDDDDGVADDAAAADFLSDLMNFVVTQS